MPVPQSDVASGPDDVRWRMVAGMDTALHYAIRLVSYGSSFVFATNSNCMEVPRALQ